ncbi:MAG TPA: anti-sigma factor [Actinomycetota bacterium]
MNEEHDRIEELLAGYVLLSLTGEDAIEADRLLSEHVPTCPMCRDTLAGFQAVAGELALAAEPVPPPDLILPRIRRDLGAPPSVRRPRRGAWLVATAAGVALLVALAGLSLSLGDRVSKAETQRGRLLEAIGAMQQGGANPVSLLSQTGTRTGGELVEISGPNMERMYLVGHDVPTPAPGSAYQLWLGTNGRFVAVGEMFLPDNGLVVVELAIPAGAGYDEVAITEEREGSQPTAPGRFRWSATL